MGPIHFFRASNLLRHEARRCLSLYNKDRLSIVRPKSCHQHPFEGNKLQSKISSLISREPSCFGEELKDWTRLLLLCAAHTSSSFAIVLNCLPEIIKQQRIVYEIHLCLLGHQIRHWKKLGVRPPALNTVDDVFTSISAKCNGEKPSFPSYFLYMDAYCSARRLEVPWMIYKMMPKPSAGDFIHLITLYNALGESARCRSLLRCIGNMRLTLNTSDAMKLAVYLAKTMPEVPHRKAIVNSLVTKYIKPESKQIYGHAAQAVLLISDRPGEVFDKMIQKSPFTIGLLFKRLIELRRFDEFSCRTVKAETVRDLGYHDYTVILTLLGHAKQFNLVSRLLTQRSASTHALTSLIAQASKYNQKDFIRRILSHWLQSMQIDSICLTAVLGAKIFDLTACELKVQHELFPDGLLYSRLLYLCRAAKDICRVWESMISRDIEPDVAVNIALQRSITNLKGLSSTYRRSLHASLIAKAILHMRSKNLKWPAILDSAIVIAGNCKAIDVQDAAYTLLRKFNMFPTSVALSQMTHLLRLSK